MTGTIEQAEADRLFQEINQAMAADDGVKLSTLLAQETPDKEQPVEDLPADEPEEEVPEVEDDTTDSDQSDKESDKEDKPSDEDGNDKEPESGDPLEALRKEIADLKKAQQSVSSQVGRIPSLQRKLSEYDSRLAELRKATPGQTSEKTLPKIDAALKDLEETDPALAKAIKTAMGEALSGVDSEANAREIARIESLRDSDYAEYAAEQKNALLSKFPNAPEVFASQAWKDWKKSQKPHVLQLATSDDAQAVILALDMYKNDMIALHPELQQKVEAPALPEVDSRAAKIEEERKSAKTKAANIGGGKPPAVSKAPLDAEALFKELSESLRKEITGK